MIAGNKRGNAAIWIIPSVVVVLALLVGGVLAVMYSNGMLLGIWSNPAQVSDIDCSEQDSKWVCHSTAWEDDGNRLKVTKGSATRLRLSDSDTSSDTKAFFREHADDINFNASKCILTSRISYHDRDDRFNGDSPAGEKITWYPYPHPAEFSDLPPIEGFSTYYVNDDGQRWLYEQETEPIPKKNWRNDVTKIRISGDMGKAEGRIKCYADTIKYGGDEGPCIVGDFDMRDYADDKPKHIQDDDGGYECAEVWVNPSNVRYIFPKKEVPPETNPEPDTPVFENIITGIIDWVKSLFDVNMAITGATTVTPGTTKDYSMSLTAPEPDTNYNDGTGQVQYASWSLVDNDGKIYAEGDWRKVNGSYSEQAELTIPDNPGEYVLVGVIYQYNMTYDYDARQWKTVSETVASREALNLENQELSAPEPGKPSFLGIFSDFWEWVTGVFG